MDEMEQLAYRNRFVHQLVQSMSDYVGADCEDSTPQVVSGEDNLIILRVSLDEWTKILSSVFTGADICYPSESDSVRWALLRAVECPVDLCAMIANCIANSEATQEAIRNFVTSDTVINQNISNISMQQALGLEQRGQNLLKPDECNPDFIFNQTSVLVQMLHDLTEDLFEALEVATNALERASIIASSIPVFGQVVPFDELLQLGDQLAEEVAEDYMGAYDEALYDALRCELFCLFKDDCSISIDQAIAFYETKVAEAFPDDPWEALKAIIGYLNVGDFGTDTPVYAMHLLVLALIRQMSTVFGVDFGIMGLRINAAGDDPDNDWEFLCPECVEPPASCAGGEFIDFRASAAMWTPYVSRALWTAGEGWGKGNLPASPTRIAIYRGMAPTPTKIKLITTGLVGEARFYAADGSGNPTAILSSDTSAVNNGDGTWTYEFPTITTSHTGNFLIDLGTSGDLGTIKLRQMCWNYD